MTNVTVNLDCRNSANSNPKNGYTNTNTSAHTTYCYLYSGGTDGHGGVIETTGTGAGTIEVTAGADPRFIIQDVHFAGDTIKDLSWAHGKTPHTAVITDTNLDNQNARYAVTVKDTTANCTFLCDPPITNKPPAN